MALGAKQKVGGMVTDCCINLGDVLMTFNLYIMILESYDMMIGMDWLESHHVILKFKMKRLILTDDKGKRRVIVGGNQELSLRFISSLQLQKSMCKGCKIYGILVLDDKGMAKGL
jgi:hypothetical protein